MTDHDKAHIPPHEGAVTNAEKPLKIRPLHDRVIVKRKESAEKSSGGIVIPDIAKEKSSEAEVLAVGPGKYLDNGTRQPLDVKPGDVVYLSSKWTGIELSLRGEKIFVVKSDDIVGIEER